MAVYIYDFVLLRIFYEGVACTSPMPIGTSVLLVIFGPTLSNILSPIGVKIKTVPKYLKSFVLNFTTPRYVILFLNSEIYIVRVINREWNRSMFVAFAVCFVWNTKPNFPTASCPGLWTHCLRTNWQWHNGILEPISRKHQPQLPS